MPDDDRTEEPTPRRREEARRRGQVARSQEVNSALVLVAFLLVAGSTVPGLLARLQAVMRDWFSSMSTLELSQDTAPGLVGGALLHAGEGLVLPLAMVGLAALAGGVLQVGFSPSMDAVMPRLDRVNPLGGLQRIFSRRALFDSLRALAKAVVIGWVAWTYARGAVPTLCGLGALEPRLMASTLGGLLLALAWRVAVVCVVIALLDYAWQRHQFEQGLRMTRQEVRQEHRQNEGDPHVRAAMRRRHQQRQSSRARIAAHVPRSDVVLTNPTHVAVALVYREGSSRAPWVSAKGLDAVALRIREVARTHHVPVLERPELARAIHGSVAEGDEIPPDMYEAVAHVFAFLQDQAARRNALEGGMGDA